MRENSLDLGGATRTFARPQVRRPIPVNSRVGVGLGVLIGAVVLGGASFLSSCAQRTSGGASSDAPNTGLNALTQEPIDQTKQSGSETPGSSPSTPRDGDTQRPGVRPGTRLDKLAADTGVDVDNILASATPASRPAPEPRPEPAQSEPAPENPTPDAEDSSLPALPDSAPNTGLAALTGEDTGVTPDAGDSQTNEATAASAADQAAKEREAQLVKLGSLRRELAVFLDARRQQGAKAMSDAATIVIGDAIGYDGDATTGTKPAAPDESTMTSQERTTLSAIRTLGRALSQDGKVAEPARAVQLVEGVLSTLREAAAVRIARSALCTRVEGFGQYEPFADNTFVAGRTTKMIVYTEIENLMFERFTDRARKVMALAKPGGPAVQPRVHRDRAHPARPGQGRLGVGANVLKNLDVDLRKVRLEVEKLVKAAPRWSPWASCPRPPAPRRSSSTPSKRPATSTTTTSAPSTCCSACCASTTASPPRSS
jgi:hypothetical protein